MRHYSNLLLAMGLGGLNTSGAQLGTDIEELRSVLHGDGGGMDGGDLRQVLGELLGGGDLDGDMDGDHTGALLGALLGKRKDQLPPRWQQSLSSIIADYQKAQQFRSRLPNHAADRLIHMLNQPMQVASQPSIAPRVPGVNAPAEGVITLGFPTQVFTATGATSYTATTLPQRPGRLKRMIMTATKTGATGGAVVVQDIKIGTVSCLLSGDPLPIEMFAGNVMDGILKPVPFSVGSTVEILFGIIGLPVGADTVIVTAGAFANTVVS